MDRAEAVKILEIQLDVTEVNTPSCIKLHEALELAIEALGDAESATITDCISRQAAIEAFCDDCRGLKPGQCEHWDSCKSQNELRLLPPVTPKEQTDCTDFINWLLAEVLDEENWELNAVANGEIICRKLKKLDLLEVKDGYYVRASVTPTERTGEWVRKQVTVDDIQFTGEECSNCNFWKNMGTWNYCPNCGAKMVDGGDV